MPNCARLARCAGDAVMESSPTSGLALLKTAGAIVVSLVVFLLVGTLLSLFYGLFLSGLTVLRPIIIESMAAAFGTVVGVVAAKAACDSILKGYVPQVVFIIFALLSAVAALNYLLIVPPAWENVPKYIVTILLPCISFATFWKDEAME
jgi:hypothetical protein